jgi:hypothetical protein
MAETSCGALPPDAKMLKLKWTICSRFEIQRYRDVTDEDSIVGIQQESIKQGCVQRDTDGPNRMIRCS